MSASLGDIILGPSLGTDAFAVPVHPRDVDRSPDADTAPTINAPPSRSVWGTSPDLTSSGPSPW